MEREKMLESKRKYFKKYYQEHKEYYHQKSREQVKRAGGSVYKAKVEKLESNINDALKYIIDELLDGDLEWHKNHYGCISGSDLPNEPILKIVEILKR